MKIRRISIQVEVPWSHTAHVESKLHGAIEAVLTDMPHRIQNWWDVSENTVLPELSPVRPHFLYGKEAK